MLLQKSTNASHEKWRCPGCIKSIIFWGNKKEVPFDHIRTNLTSMGIDKNTFLEWLEKNC